MIVTGLRKPEKEETNDEDSKRASEAGLDEGEFMKYVDKVLPVGCRENGKQSRIIKFTTHSFKKKVFLKHKQNKKNEIEKRKQNLNVEPSLSRFRTALPKKANENTKFAYTNMHGNLKFILSNPLDGKYVKQF